MLPSSEAGRGLWIGLQLVFGGKPRQVYASADLRGKKTELEFY